MGEKTVTAMYTSKDNLTPLLYSGKIKKKKKKKKKKSCCLFFFNEIRIKANFSTEKLQKRREWQEIFKVLKGKNMQPRILYLARISLKIEGEIKSSEQQI